MAGETPRTTGRGWPFATGGSRSVSPGLPHRSWPARSDAPTARTSCGSSGSWRRPPAPVRCSAPATSDERRDLDVIEPCPGFKRAGGGSWGAEASGGVACSLIRAESVSRTDLRSRRQRSEWPTIQTSGATSANSECQRFHQVRERPLKLLCNILPLRVAVIRDVHHSRPHQRPSLALT